MRELRYTFVVTTIALCATYLIIIVFDGVSELANHLAVATTAPIMIAPPIAFLGMRRKLSIERLNDRLNYLLYHDDLTGAATRSQLIEVCAQETGTGALLLLDADKFKNLNDKYGHVTGDEALRHLADAMRAVVRKHDVVARWGGEEFVIFLKEAGLDAATRIYDRLIELLNSRSLSTAMGDIQVTASIGVTICRPDEKLETVIDRADTALYKAKLAGRNRYVVAPSEATGVVSRNRTRMPKSLRPEPASA